MAKIGRKPADYELIEGGAGGGRSGGGSISGGGGQSKALPHTPLRYKRGEERPMTKELALDVAKGMSPAIVAGVGGIGGAALSQSQGRRRDEAAREAKGELKRESRGIKDTSDRHYKGMANATKQK